MKTIDNPMKTIDNPMKTIDNPSYIPSFELTIDISPTKTIVTLDLFAPTWLTMGHHPVG